MIKTALAAALLLPFAAVPLAAQDYRGAWTVYGGGVWFSEFNDNGVLDDADGFFFEEQQFARTDLALEAGWIAGTQLEQWFGQGRFGVRLNGSYTERPFELAANDDADIFEEEFFATRFEREFEFGAVNTWLGNVDLLVRLAQPMPDRAVAPYLALGAGVAHYNPAGDAGLLFPSANARVGFDEGDTGLAIGNTFVREDGDNSETSFAGVIGIGADILPGWSIGGLDLGLNVELVDHIAFDSPAEPIREVEDGFFVADEDEDFSAVHNVRLTVGVKTLWGSIFERETVAALPAPAPVPAPAPAEEPVAVCVISPTLNPAGVGVVSGVYVPSTQDTLITVDGQQVLIERVTEPVAVATDFDWFRAGQPLVLDAADERVEFVSFGETMIIERKLVFLGNLNGLPVYAAEDDVTGFIEELRELGAARDLEDVLEQRADLREEFEDIERLYVPMDPVGCAFQPLTRVDEVQKSRN